MNTGNQYPSDAGILVQILVISSALSDLEFVSFPIPIFFTMKISPQNGYNFGIMYEEHSNWTYLGRIRAVEMISKNILKIFLMNKNYNCLVNSFLILKCLATPLRMSFNIIHHLKNILTMTESIGYTFTYSYIFVILRY